MSSTSAPATERLAHAALLVELGSLHEAELEVAEVLEAVPDDLDALGLYAKIKHVRGELSQAIACWAQLHARALQHERATLELRALMTLADDPERGASEFIAAGPFQLLRKPSAVMALEDAFANLRAHQPDRAQARCMELAGRSRERDPATYKLAVLALAWITELSGQLEQSAACLERLGRERGFEHDIDRLLALVRVYEQLGSPDRLRSAIRVLAHLEEELSRLGAPKITLLARRAAIVRRLGDEARAIELDQRYLAAFRRRAHRPTLAEASRAAARRYVPLARLLGARMPPPGAGPDESRRTRAIAAALEGDRETARALLSSASGALDEKYLADLAALDGDETEAARRYVATRAVDPDDPHVLAWLLDHAERAGSELVRTHLAREPGLSRARSCLLAAVERAPRRVAPWRQLATLAELAGDDASASRFAQTAATLAIGNERDTNPIGRVLTASVYHFVGKNKGLIHEIWAHRRAVAPGTGGLLAREDVLGNLTDEMKESIRNVFLAVREYAQAVFPQRTGDIADYAYTFKVPKEDEPSGGLSAGLPTALVFLSVLVQRPIPQDLAFTGTLIADAHDVLTVGRVGEIDAKVKAAFDRNLRAIVIPTRNRPDLEASALIPPAIRDEVVRCVADLDEAVRMVWGASAFSEP